MHVIFDTKTCPFCKSEHEQGTEVCLDCRHKYDRGYEPCDTCGKLARYDYLGYPVTVIDCEPCHNRKEFFSMLADARHERFMKRLSGDIYVPQRRAA